MKTFGSVVLGVISLLAVCGPRPVANGQLIREHRSEHIGAEQVVMRESMWPATKLQVKSIRDIFDQSGLSQTQQMVLMRLLAGHTDVENLTQGQATVVLSALIARGRDELSEWADAMNRPGRIE